MLVTSSTVDNNNSFGDGGGIYSDYIGVALTTADVSGNIAP